MRQIYSKMVTDNIFYVMYFKLLAIKTKKLVIFKAGIIYVEF